MDDVSKFLQDVKEMNARRTEEDDARQRELDEKIQQEKRERQARRAGMSVSSLVVLVGCLVAPAVLMHIVCFPALDRRAAPTLSASGVVALDTLLFFSCRLCWPALVVRPRFLPPA